MRVTVLGAGPAGASAAITLRERGVDTVLVDPFPKTRWRMGEGLPAAAGELLRTLGVWEAFNRQGHLPCSGFLSCWGDSEPAFRSSVFNPYGPSWQLDRAAFDEMLVAAAIAAGAAGVRPWRLVGAERDRRHWVLRFAERQGPVTHELATDFVVDATGRRSSFARVLGVARHVHSHTVCVAGLLEDLQPDDATAVVEAVPHGWWYASRVPGRRLVVGLFTDAATAKRLRLTTVPAWTELLGQSRLARARAAWPQVPPPETLRTAAAGSSSLVSFAAMDWVAVGDAACAHDPLSSQGLHDALSTGIHGATCAALALAGDSTAPRRYAAAMSAGYHKYLAELAWYYQHEARFADMPFWRRRRIAEAD
jgi:flavin-dependent dehydrogenase